MPPAIAPFRHAVPRGSPVRALTSSPALDIVGVGLGDGRAVLLNVRYDEVLSSFKNASGAGLGGFESSLGGPEGKARTGSACTAISFRTGACIARLKSHIRGDAPRHASLRHTPWGTHLAAPLIAPSADGIGLTTCLAQVVTCL